MIKVNNKKRNLNFLNGLDLANIKIGIAATDEAKRKIGLQNLGDTVVPNIKFGKDCKQNVCGYSYTDKTKKKIRRYVTTNYIKPYGNEDADDVAVDIYRKCWPKIYVEPNGIEFYLTKNDKNEEFILADLTNKSNDANILTALHMFVEIYDQCCIYNNGLKTMESKRTRCNWVMLPPGELPSKHLTKEHNSDQKSIKGFDIHRLEVVECENFELCVEGANGFFGYYAYIMDKCCVLENPQYGNATYIIPKDNWEELSKLTKEQLLSNNNVLHKIIHNKNWEANFKAIIKQFVKKD